MKHLFRYLNIATLFIALSAVFAACTDNDDLDNGNLGLNIKVFAPTVVVPGTPMTINGSGFGDVTEIIFPGDITVTDFEIITAEMIRVNAPEGLSQAGTIKVVNEAGEMAESRLALTIGNTTISGYSIQEGDTIQGNQALTIYGKDMQFVKGVEFINEDNEPVYIPASEFMRIASGRVVVQVPAKVLEAAFPVKIYVGNQIVESPEFYFEPASDGGYWSTTKRYIWQNDGSNGAVSWNGVYRFSNVETSTGEEIYAIPMEDWALIKDDVVYFEYDGNDGSNVRITTGWWTGAYGGAEHNSIDFAVDDADTGLKVIALNIKEDGNLYDNIDAQHLLFTGDAYTPMGIYVLEKVWVEGEGHFEKVRTTFWKNGEQSTIPAPSWSGEGRFSSASHSTGEETWAFPDEEWEILKTQPFRIAIEKNADWVNLRLTTGWWSTNYMGLESLNDLIEQAEDGSYFVEINLANDPALLALIDEQHLLFTGQDYKLLEIYQETEVWVGGGETKPEPIVIWENDGSNGAVSWNGVYRFSNTDSSTGEEIYAIPMDQWEIIKDGTFYFAYEGDEGSNVRITTGWWTGAYGGAEHNAIDFAVDDADTGLKVIKINLKEDGNLYDNIDAQHLLFTGDAYTPKKIYYFK